MKNNYLVSETKFNEGGYHVHPLGSERYKIHNLLCKLIDELKLTEGNIV